MKYWYINFADINNKKYQIRIYEDLTAGSVTATELTGADNPITVDENDDEDIFIPIRRQSGIISFIATDNSWKQIVPEGAFSRPVVLLSGNSYSTLEWRGFLRPETFSGKYNEPYQRIDLPVVCTLSVLDAIPFLIQPLDPQDYQGMNSWTPSFRETIDYIISETMYQRTQGMYNITVNYQQATSQSFTTFMNLCYTLCMNNEFDTTGKLVARYSCYEVLEAICTYFGLSCRTHKGMAYITFADDDEWKGGPSSWHEIAPTQWPFMTEDNFETYINGVRKVSVVASVGNDNVSLRPPLDYILEQNFGNGSSFTTYGTAGRRYQKNNVGTNYTTGEYSALAQFGASFSIIDYIDNYVVGQDFEWEVLPTIPSGNYSEDINYSPTKDYIVFTHNKPISISDGTLHISFNMFRYITDSGKAVKEYFSMQGADMGYTGVSVKLRIGTMYYKGTTAGWQTEHPEDRFLGFNIFNIDGHFSVDVPVNQMLTGDMELAIMTGPYYFGQPNISLVENISVSYARGQLRNKQQNVFINEFQNNFEGEYEQSTIFATDTITTAYGDGLVLTPGGRFYRDAGAGTPEERLSNRIAHYWQYRKTVLNFSLAESEMDFLDPLCTIEDSETGKLYCPISISHRWADDIVNVKLMEINT